MQNKSDKLSITLKFGNRILPMVVARDDEYIYREAEKLINRRFNYYAAQYPNQGNDMYMLMMALDVAVRLKRMEAETDPAPVEDALKAMIAELEQVIEKK